MKEKNPLYVVKGKTVLEAKGVFDAIVKKLGLEPAIDMLKNVVEMLLKQVTNYHTFILIKQVVDELLAKVIALAQKFTHPSTNGAS